MVASRAMDKMRFSRSRIGANKRHEIDKVLGGVCGYLGELSPFRSCATGLSRSGHKIGGHTTVKNLVALLYLVGILPRYLWRTLCVTPMHSTWALMQSHRRHQAAPCTRDVVYDIRAC